MPNRGSATSCRPIGTCSISGRAGLEDRPDGHPQRGGCLPPVELPRRRNAGNRIELIKPVRIGDTLSREAKVTDVQGKTGSSGAMVFVTVRNTISGGDGPAIVHEQDLVYRGDPAPDAKPATPKAAPADATWSRTVTPDPVLLFRYSALVFVGHRIHYDLPYVTQVEGYPGLLVHGPLMGLMAELARARKPGPPRRTLRVPRHQPGLPHRAVHGERARRDGRHRHDLDRQCPGALCQQGKVTFAT